MPIDPFALAKIQGIRDLGGKFPAKLVP